MHLTVNARRILLSAKQEAQRLGHSYVGSVHLLLALSLEPGRVGQQLRFAGGYWERLEQMAVMLYGKGTSGLPLYQGFSAEAAQILRQAAQEAIFHGQSRVGRIHIFLAYAGKGFAAVLRYPGRGTVFYGGRCNTRAACARNEEGGGCNEIIGPIQ